MKQNNVSKCEALIQEAHRYHQQGMFEQAEAACRKAQKMQPLNFNALQMLGAIALEKRNYRQATQFLAAASDIHRDIPGLMVNLGIAYRHNGQFRQAKASFEKAIGLDKNFGPAYFNLAGILADENDLAGSYAMLGEAERCRPNHLPTLELMASVLRRMGFYIESADYCRRVMAICQPTAEQYFALGLTLQAAKAYQEAADACTRAIGLAPDRLDIQAKLAEVLEAMNRLDEARSQAQAILACDTGHRVASLVLARIERREGKLEAARDRLAALSAGDSPDDIDAAVQTELGMIQDRLGVHAAAFESFARANEVMAIQPEAKACDWDKALQLVERCEKQLDTSRFPVTEVDDGLPTPVFLVGFPRSGTTLTEQILASHDNVATGDEHSVLHDMAMSLTALLGRELEYPECLDGLSVDDISKLRTHYWERMVLLEGEGVRDKLYIDKMPLNIIHLGFIQRLFPQARIIVALRDPRDVCLSCFMQLFSLNEAMVQFLSLDRTASYYAAVMGLWLRYRERIALPWIESRYEDIVADANIATRRLNEFLGLETSEAQAKFYEQAAKRTISTPSYQDVSTPVYDRAKGRWHHYASQMSPFLKTLEPCVLAFGYRSGEIEPRGKMVVSAG